MTSTTETKKEGAIKSKGNYGIRVARPGYDAGTCADNKLLFNSAWPIIQITKVIDFDTRGVEYITYRNLTTDEITETDPGGLTVTYTEEIVSYYVSSTYAYKLLESQIAKDSNNVRWGIYKFKRSHHDLGFPPLFYQSDWVSELTGKVILTNIDISTDISYPYTDSPTVFIKGQHDYGIKSSSIFGSKVPGLNTNTFSKLVQRVMTTQSSGTISKEDGEIVDKSLYWYVGENHSAGEDIDREDAIELVQQYEVYSFSKDSWKMTNDPLYSYDATYWAMAQDTEGSYPVGFTNTHQAPTTYDKSMVIVRSPMVSPEYEEITI